MARKEFVFVEKYRPKKIQQCILPNKIKKTFQDFVDDGNCINLLLSGTAGVGKTTVAKALANELDYEYLMINGSEQRPIDTLRTTIKQFASSVSLNGNAKLVILDEADYLNPQSTQPALRGFIEEFSKNCRFILTCNYKNKIIEPLQSRCTTIEFSIPPEEKQELAKQFYKRTLQILENEEITYDKKVVAQLVKKHFPDFRRVLNEIQRYSVSGSIDAGILASVSDTQLNILIKLLKQKDFSKARKWVVENLDTDIDLLIRWIYDNIVDLMEPNSVPEAVLIMNEYMYKHSFVSDPEINIVSMLVELMNSIQWKE